MNDFWKFISWYSFLYCLQWSLPTGNNKYCKVFISSSIRIVIFCFVLKLLFVCNNWNNRLNIFWTLFLLLFSLLESLRQLLKYFLNSFFLLLFSLLKSLREEYYSKKKVYEIFFDFSEIYMIRLPALLYHPIFVLRELLFVPKFGVSCSSENLCFYEE